MNILHPRPHRHKKLGFTLVELLVVITIVVVLAAIGFIGTSKFRERAQVANSINSLRQIGTAHLSYATDNHGAVNTLNEAAEEGGGDVQPENSFWYRMQPHLFSGISSNDEAQSKRQLELAINALFNTTNARTMVGTPYNGIPAFVDSADLPLPIGFNEAFEPKDGQQAQINVHGDPSRIIYSAYGNRFFNSSHGATYTTMPQGGTAAAGIYFLKDRKAIVCFLDGHVETMTPPIPERLFE